MSSIVNKVKEALHSDKSTTTGQPEGTHGTHNTRAANTADPRIDSDRDHRAAHNTTTGTHTTGTHVGGGDYSNTGGLGSNTHTGQHTTTAGGLGSNTHSGQHTTAGGLGSNTHTGQHTTAGGVGSDSRAYGTTDGPASKTDGPHKSNLLNKADPRVDSDRDHSTNLGANPHGTSGTGAYDVNQTTRTGGAGGFGASNPTHTGGIGTSTGGLGSSNTHGTAAHTGGFGNQHTTTGGNSNLPEGTVGPHSSRVANAADPRIDSDLDSNNRRQGTNTGAGGFGSSTTHGTSAHTGGLGNQNTAGGFGNQHTTAGGYNNNLPEGTVGPHSSRVANAADPRIDSDLDSNNRRQGTNTGAGGFGSSNTHGTNNGAIGSNTHTGQHTTAGGLGSNTTHGTSAHTGAIGSNTHNTHGNQGLGSSTTTGGAYGTGPAPNTTGPHKSDMLNKLDPRVDSNLDGSKTYGGDKTFSQSNETSAYANKDPTDAAQVPPSVLQKHVGAPTVTHGHEDHDHARRHSVSHQEQHRGL